MRSINQHTEIRWALQIKEFKATVQRNIPTDPSKMILFILDTALIRERISAVKSIIVGQPTILHTFEIPP